MHEESEVELIMQCKVRTRSHRFLVPNATSTPIRKALRTLSNSPLVWNGREANLIKPKPADKSGIPNEINCLKGCKEKSIKIASHKDLTKELQTTFSSDEECDKNDKKSSELKKNLIIKLGTGEKNCTVTTKKLNVKSPKRNNSKQFIPRRLNMKANGSNCELKSIKNATAEENVESKSENHTLSGIAETPKRGIGNQETTKSSFALQSSYSSHLSASHSSALQSTQNKKIGGNLKKKSHTTPSKHISNKRKRNDIKEEKLLNTKNLIVSEVAKNSKLYPVLIGNDKDGINAINENISNIHISHEIFSDNKEKEHRDSLDLTEVDIEDSPLNSNHAQLSSKSNKKAKNPLCLKNSKTKIETEVENADSNKVLQGNEPPDVWRSKRIRKSPKEFWLPKSEISQDSACQNSRVCNKVKTGCEGISSLQDSRNSSISESHIKNEQQASSKHSDFVKDISALQYEKRSSENDNSEFLTALGWKFSTFKCCVLKIGSKCQASGRTKSEKSHFGGIVLKGKLLMKIQDDDAIVIKNGQMFYIPPLCDWSVVNNWRNECMVYYWCGKF